MPLKSPYSQPTEKKPLQVGITGGIGSGKSLVCKIFGVLGAPAYDADSRAKILMTTDGILIEEIKKEFGSLSYDGAGRLNRVFLSGVVFSDQKKREKLNSLVHPRVAIDYKKWLESLSGYRYVIKEAALMFESDSYKVLDKIVLVSAPEEIRIARVLARDPQRTPNQVKEIILSQMKEDEKLMMADFVLHNDDTKLLIPQVLHLHQIFTT
jgi:dephospho-CoA kinase